MKNNKVLVINHVPGHSSKIRALINILAKDQRNEVCLVAFNGTERELERQNLSYKTPTNYMGKEDYAQLEEASIAFLKSLGSKKFDGDMSLVKLLEYEHTSLWWFNEGNFWRHLVRDVIRYVESLMRIIDEEEPGRIVAVNDNSPLAKTTIAIGQARGIPVQTLSPRFSLRLKMAMKSLWTRLKPQTIPRLRVVRDVLRKNMERLFGPAPQKDRDGKRILLAAPTRETEEVVDPKSGKKSRENLYLGPIMRELGRDNTDEMIFLYTFTKAFSLKVPREVRRSQAIVRPWEYYVTGRIHQIVSEQTKRLKRKWQQLESSPSFQELFLYKDISLWGTLKDEVKLRFYSHFPIFIRDIEISKQVTERENIDMVVIVDEARSCNKGLLVVAYSKKIPTLEIQDGVEVVSNVFLECGCSLDELQGEPSKRPLIPDKFCVYGADSKDVFKEARYPFYDSIIVTGQPRYDILARAGEIFNREKFCGNLKIDPKKKIVLIGSQLLMMFGNREIFFRNIFQALKGDPQIQIIIKPHPSEKGGWHKRLAEEMGVEVVVLPRNSNTNEALYACDVLVTFYSTVALEAMILGKPVITINLTNQPDPVPYAKSGAAIGVYRSEDIAVAVKKALDDPETGRSLKLGREKYLYEQFYKLDGQATKRVVDLIYEMVKERASPK